MKLDIIHCSLAGFVAGAALLAVASAAAAGPGVEQAFLGAPTTANPGGINTYYYQTSSGSGQIGGQSLDTGLDTWSESLRLGSNFAYVEAVSNNSCQTPIQGYCYINNNFANSLGSEGYTATIVGPTTAAPIPVDVAANLAVSSNDPNGDAFAEIFAGGQYGFLSALPTGVLQSSSPVLSFSESIDTPFTIQILAHSLIDNGSGYAFVDPLITIDSSFASTDPNYKIDYSIVLSGGTLNGFAVSEPSTWAMMLMGIGGLGGVLRLARERQGLPGKLKSCKSVEM